MNIYAVVLATIAAFVVGFIWFNQKTFYPAWYRALGKEMPVAPAEGWSEEEKKEGNAMMAGTFLAQVGQALVMYWLIDVCATAYQTMDAGFGALIGLIAGFGISALSSLPHRLFAKQGFKVWAIEVGGDIVALVAMGAIIGAFLAR